MEQRYYCDTTHRVQGHQWNVKVFVFQRDDGAGWALITGNDLFGTFEDKSHNGWMVVPVNELFIEPQFCNDCGCVCQ